MKRGLLVSLCLSASFLILEATRVQAAGNAPQPSICNRACWGSRSVAAGPFGWNSTWDRAVIHHTANTGDYNVTSIEDSKARVRGTQNYHMDVLGWSDIGYHFLVDKFGNKFEGLSGSLGSSYPRGAHDAINNNSMGISMLGWFDSGYNGTPPQVMRNAVYDVIAWRLPNPFNGYGSSSYGGYSNIGYVCGHYNVSTKTCPGTQMQPYIGTDMYGGEARNYINQKITGGTPWAATYVSNTFVSEVRVNQLATVSVTFKNSGTSTWNSSTKLGTSNPRDRSSSFYYSSDWPGPNRPTVCDQSSVAPNANGTFTFIAKAPSTPGSYQESFELLQEGVTWFEGTGDNVIWYVNVVPPPDWEAQYVSNTFPAQVTAGQTVTCSVTFKNTGGQTWNSNTRLGTSNPRDRSSAFYNSSDWLGANRPTAVDASTAPGANGTFTFVAKAPTTAGSYQEHFELVQEGVTWFPAGASVIWYVDVVAPTPTPSPTPSPSPTPTVTPAPVDIIIDNTSSAVTYTGSWSTGTSATGKYGSDYRYASSGTGAEAKYSFTGLTPGTYRVYVWYPAGTNRANNAPHRVDHYSGATSYSVNQQINGGQWVTLGDHYFNTTGYVVVRTTGANPSVVMADAVRLYRIGN